jgi:hypothetical protein
MCSWKLEQEKLWHVTFCASCHSTTNDTLGRFKVLQKARGEVCYYLYIISTPFSSCLHRLGWSRRSLPWTWELQIWLHLVEGSTRNARMHCHCGRYLIRERHNNIQWYYNPFRLSSSSTGGIVFTQYSFNTARHIRWPQSSYRCYKCSAPKSSWRR